MSMLLSCERHADWLPLSVNTPNQEVLAAILCLGRTKAQESSETKVQNTQRGQGRSTLTPRPAQGVPQGPPRPKNIILFCFSPWYAQGTLTCKRTWHPTQRVLRKIFYKNISFFALWGPPRPP